MPQPALNATLVHHSYEHGQCLPFHGSALAAQGLLIELGRTDAEKKRMAGLIAERTARLPGNNSPQ
jgi:hypothetical protein